MGKLKKYKLKTHKATAKRFRMTGSGKVMQTKGGKSHLRRRTPKRTKAKFTRMLEMVNNTNARRVKRLAPYMHRYRANPPA